MRKFRGMRILRARNKELHIVVLISFSVVACIAVSPMNISDFKIRRSSHRSELRVASGRCEQAGNRTHDE